MPSDPPPAPPPRPAPAEHERLAGLARRFGTPLYVIDEATLRANARSARAALQAAADDVEVYFSYKTNPLLAVLRILRDEGLGAEVISAHEAWLAQQVGVPAERVIVNGPVKPPALLEHALQHRTRAVFVDSTDELETLIALAGTRPRPLPVGLRIAPRMGWRAHFGFTPTAALTAASVIRASPALELAGLSVHLGTNIGTTAPYERAVRDLVALMAELRPRGAPIRMLDLGGGFGVPAVRSLRRTQRWRLKLRGRLPPLASHPHPPTAPEFAAAIRTALRTALARHAIPEPTLLFEPGRLVTSSAQTLLARVHAVKHTAGTPTAVTDVGAMCVAPILAKEEHRIEKIGAGPPGTRRQHHIVGPLCTPADRLPVPAWLPPLQAGDLLAIADAGAYFTPTENRFGPPPPACVMVGPDGEACLVRRQESDDDRVVTQQQEPRAP